ncbi:MULTISPECIES: hypothetical protein [Burkholderia]|uniref:hypothetical protein n=1 Tax=Burkholderia TaxID=32008 RepID=UPI0011AE1B4A|nr:MULTISPECIES: hypothetical protein [Burkholderia]
MDSLSTALRVDDGLDTIATAGGDRERRVAASDDHTAGATPPQSATRGRRAENYGRINGTPTSAE